MNEERLDDPFYDDVDAFEEQLGAELIRNGVIERW